MFVIKDDTLTPLRPKLTRTLSKCYYIAISSAVEGIGKTTLCENLANHLAMRGLIVLTTKEPGTPHSGLSLKLRALMLDQFYENEMSPIGREYIFQSIRANHLSKTVAPAILRNDVDVIIQDRCLLDGLAYGNICLGPQRDAVDTLYPMTTFEFGEMTGRKLPEQIYDQVIRLDLGSNCPCNISETYVCHSNKYASAEAEMANFLLRTKSRSQEFKQGDAIELRGPKFLLDVNRVMTTLYSSRFKAVPLYVSPETTQKTLLDMTLEKLALIPELGSYLKQNENQTNNV